MRLMIAVKILLLNDQTRGNKPAYLCCWLCIVKLHCIGSFEKAQRDPCLQGLAPKKATTADQTDSSLLQLEEHDQYAGTI